jgi:hypothetical protein
MTFASDLNRFTQTATNRSHEVVKRVVLQLGKEVVDMSIVGDTNYWSSKPPRGYVGGKFRGNWQHGIGSMPITKFDTTDNISLQRIERTVPAQSAGLIHWLVNNVPYSIALENGTASPRTPPQGIVGVTVLRFDRIVRDIARRVRG